MVKNLSQPEIERTLDVVHRLVRAPWWYNKGGRLDLSNKGQPQGQQPPAQTNAPQTTSAPTRVIQYDASGKRL